MQKQPLSHHLLGPCSLILPLVSPVGANSPIVLLVLSHPSLVPPRSLKVKAWVTVLGDIWPHLPCPTPSLNRGAALHALHQLQTCPRFPLPVLPVPTSQWFSSSWFERLLLKAQSPQIHRIVPPFTSCLKFFLRGSVRNFGFILIFHQLPGHCLTLSRVKTKYKPGIEAGATQGAGDHKFKTSLGNIANSYSK